MPLRDHYRPPLDDETQWEGFHASWPVMIVAHLTRRLPHRYVAAPRVHSGAAVEIDVATFEKDAADPSPLRESQSNGGVATAVWAPPRPTLTVATDLPALDDYEVRVYDSKRGRRLVAAVEIVSPANKDRPDHRHAFVAKCLALLQTQVCVAVVDLVTTRNFNLYTELLASLGQSDPDLEPESPGLYSAVCRAMKSGDAWRLEGWAYPLTLGQLLPTLPLWLAENLAVPLELEASYEETCRILRIA
jgi:Protein of unknown function (DUF4058)